MDLFVESFLSHAGAQPMAPACLSPRRVRTRGELAAQVATMTAALMRRGIDAGAVVALAAPPGPAFIAAFLALRTRGVCALLTDVATADSERSRVEERLGAGHRWCIEDGWDESELPGEFEATPSAGARLPDIAALKLTSGSTGEPAGVAVSARELVADGRNLFASMGLDGADRFLCTISFSHSYGFSLLPTGLCLFGASLVLPDGEDPLEVARAEEATVLPSVPAWFHAQLGLLREDSLPASLRLCISAGAPLPARTAREWRERSGKPIHAFYGSSECGGITFDRKGDAAERGTVGTPIAGVEVELVPAPASAEIGVGAGVGVVRVRSAAVASGYHPHDPARAARLAAGVFETEDLATFEGDELMLRGRRSVWINVKGHKVDPREVERVLEELPGLREVAIVAEALPAGRGEALRAIVACEEGRLSYRDVVGWCRARLAAHKIPRSVLLVRELPRDGRGKLDRAALGALSGQNGSARTAPHSFEDR